MKQNKQFFDELDNNWEDTLTGIYKEHNDILFYDTHRDINLTLTNQHNPKVYKAQVKVNYYEEEYKAHDEVNINYSIDLTLYFKSEHELIFSTVIRNTDRLIDSSYMDIIFYIKDERISKDITSDYVEEIIKIEPTFLKNYLNRARPYIKLDTTDTTNNKRLYDVFLEGVLNTVPDPNI